MAIRLGDFTMNVTIVGAAHVIGLLVGLATSIMIVRLLGPEDKGVYSLAIIAISLIGPLLVSGGAARRSPGVSFSRHYT